MKTFVQKTIVGLVLVAFLSGCIPSQNNSGTDSGMKPDSTASSDDATRTKTEGAVGGAALGALVLGAVGYAVGGKEGAALGIGLGAALGGLGGYKYGETIADRKQQYANKENQLEGETKYYGSKNLELKKQNHETSEQIIALNNQLKNVKSQNTVASITAQQKENYLKQIEADEGKEAGLNNELAALVEYQNSLKQAGGDQYKTKQLEAEVVALKENIAMLDSNNKQMAKIVQALPVRG